MSEFSANQSLKGSACPLARALSACTDDRNFIIGAFAVSIQVHGPKTCKAKGMLIQYTGTQRRGSAVSAGACRAGLRAVARKDGRAAAPRMKGRADRHAGASARRERIPGPRQDGEVRRTEPKNAEEQPRRNDRWHRILCSRL